MRSKKLFLHIPMFMLAAAFINGCATQTASVSAQRTAAPATVSAVVSTPETAAPSAVQTLVAKGKILGVSKKAKSISIQVGDATQMIKFTGETQGIEHAKKGEAAIINYKLLGAEKVATVIQPKLAKLPAGTTEMMPSELVTKVAMGSNIGNYFLVDARPATRYAAGHIPTAVSIPVGKFKEKGAELLPAEKDKLLIFYCGGPT